MQRYKAGDVVGPWTLISALGAGGNGEVWHATDGEREVALKVLRAVNPSSEPYRRFRNEVEAAAACGDVSGVLPVVASSLPEKPARKDPPWIAMVIAEPLVEALAGAPLELIVQAIASLAGTLATLAERDIFHRDIKPGNLYRYEGGWAVGDFGLVSLPEPSSLTGDRFGPFGYMPDEMFQDAASAAGGPVDVFQLAKTLTALVAQQVYPPQGHIAAGSSGAVGRFAAHPRIAEIESLVDAATRYDPAERPTMRDVANELEAWLREPPVATSDLGTAATRFRAAHAHNIAERDRVAAWRRAFGELSEEIRYGPIEDIQQALVQAGLQAVVTTSHKQDAALTLIRSFGDVLALNFGHLWVVAEYGPLGSVTEIAVGIGFDLNEEGELWLVGEVAFGDLDSFGGSQWRSEQRTAPVESHALVEDHLKRLTAEMHEVVANALNQISAGN